MAAVIATVSLTAVAGCSREGPLSAPSPTGVVAQECAAVMAALPDQLMGQQRERSEPTLATWGDPAITVRCGVERPSAMERTSRCDVLDGVGWFAQDPGTVRPKAWTFTTIGRSGYLEVIVPENYEPAGDALIDLAPAARKLTQVTPCQ